MITIYLFSNDAISCSNDLKFVYFQEGKPLSFIDNYGRLYKDKEQNWISEVAQEKYVSYEEFTFH